MPETLEDLVMLQPPTSERPLLGTIVLVVEDSRHACEGLRLICQRLGARIRRAESLASAARHLRTYLPRIAVVDLGLPDGSGLQLIEQLVRAEPRINGIIATSGDETLREVAMKAGADVFLPKPLTSVVEFQKVALGLMPSDLRPARVQRPSIDNVEPDQMALRDDMYLIVDLLRSYPDAETLDYVAGFLAGLAKNADDEGLAAFGAQVRAIRLDNGCTTSPAQIADAIEARATNLETV